MGSRLFVRASSQSIRDSSTLSSAATAHTQVALVTVASTPGAAAYHCVHGFSSGTAARELALELNGDTGGTLGAKVGSTRVVPSTNMVPNTDGRWYLIGAAKAAGTVTVAFFMFDYSGATWTEFNSAGTVANRTASSTTQAVGSLGAANFWDGRIAAVMILSTALVSGQWRRLVSDRRAWAAQIEKNPAGSQRDSLIDLSFPWTLATATPDNIDHRFGDGSCNRIFSVGTQPSLDALAHPPGW